MLPSLGNRLMFSAGTLSRTNVLTRNTAKEPLPEGTSEVWGQPPIIASFLTGDFSPTLPEPIHSNLRTRDLLGNRC